MQSDQKILDCPVSRHRLLRPAVRMMFGADGQNWPGFEFDCPHCGAFVVDELEYHHLIGYLNADKVPMPVTTSRQSDRHRAVMAHALRRMSLTSQKPILKDDMTSRILEEDRLPNLAEQGDNLLRWFGTEMEIGRIYSVDHNSLGARVGSSSPGAFHLLLQNMLASGLLNGRLGADGVGALRIDYKGLERLEQLERATPSGYNAFMAMKFGDPSLDQIVRDHFRPAVAETGFKLYRLDDRPEAGLIDARLRNEIRNSRFLIADLSHANAGSYWEAGYAEGLGKPVIYTCEKSVFDGKADGVAKPHFDTNHHLTITWDLTDPALAAKRLTETIRFTIPEARQAN